MPSFEAPTNASNEPKSSGETPVEGLEKLEKVGNTEAEVLRGPKLVVVCVAFSLAFFLIALDQTILSTALPSIASDFDAVSELSWIASGYFLPQAAFMLFFGKVLAFTSPNVVLLVSIAIFELGSLLSALSPTIFALIFGRVISGIGASALFIAVMSLIARITTLKQRPLMMSIIGAVFAASSLGGPVIGGAFSDNITWRWCFYVNLPIGGFAFVMILAFLPKLPAMEKSETMLSPWLNMDWIGTLLSFGFVTFMLIALQWGGNERPWSDPVVIVFLVLSGVLMVAFVAWEHRLGSRALVPIDMMLRKNVFASSFSALFGHLCFVIFTYYLPLLYQVRGHSATRSGVDIIPFMISGVISSMVAGGVASETGWAWPFLVFAPLLAAVGFGLFFEVSQNTSSSHIAGLQILVGIGLGCVVQLPIVVAQAEYVNEEHLVPQVTSLATFIQIIGSSAGLAIAGAVFAASLESRLDTLPSLSPSQIGAVRSSVEAIFSLPDPQKQEASGAYVAAIQRVWLIGVPSAALAAMVALIITRKRIRKVEGH